MTEREDHVPNRARLRKRFEQYEKLAEELCRRAKRPETVARLERLRARLRQGPVRLLVVGVSCSGKSTLINALSGEFVAPEGDYVTSCVPLWVSGREPDPEDNRPRFRALYWGRDGSFYAQPNNQAIALTKLCHVPGHRAQVPEGLEAMTAQVGGGFLWESGLTLVDTPGIGQQAADDAQTRTAIDRGAELLLIVHRTPAVSDGNGDGSVIADAAFLQSLFPGGARDLHLDMKRDLFLLGNNALGGKGSEESIRNALKKLVSQWNMSGERRFYWVDVLRQRQRVGYYRYTDWFPEGADEETLLAREKGDRHAWEQLLEARRQVGPSAGEEAQIEAEEELKAQERLEQAVDEKGRQDILRMAVLRKSRALRDSRNMESLRRALTARALELYEDPDRLCAPIEEELRQAVREMAEDCRQRMERTKQEIERELAAIPDERVTSRVLNELRDKEKRLNAAIEDLSQASDWLEEQTQQFVQEQARMQKRRRDWENEDKCSDILAQFTRYATEKKPKIHADAMTLWKGEWEQKIVRPLTEEYIRRRTRVQTGLVEGQVSLPSSWGNPEQWAWQTGGIIRILNSKLPAGIKPYALSDNLLQLKWNPFLTRMKKETQTDARELKEELSQTLSAQQAGMSNPVAETAGKAAKVTGFVIAGVVGAALRMPSSAMGYEASKVMRSGTTPAVKDTVEWGLTRSIAGIWKDVNEYIRVQNEYGTELTRELKRIGHDLRGRGETLSSQREANRKEMAKTLVQARNNLIRQRHREELAPLEEELQQLRQLVRQEKWMEVSV